jgi:hypothetical protein
VEEGRDEVDGPATSTRSGKAGNKKKKKNEKMMLERPSSLA